MTTIANVDTHPGITTFATGLGFEPDIPYEQWAEFGEHLAGAEATLMWAVGDWMHFGAEHYQAKAVQLASAIGLSEKTVWNATSVCKRVPLEVRRQELSFGHHEAVAAQPAEVQKAWLQMAVDEGLSVYALRDRLAASREPKALPDIGKSRRLPVRFNVTCPMDVPQDVFQEGVHHAALALHAWLGERGYDTDIAEVL